jgi:hypothetical protein
MTRPTLMQLADRLMASERVAPPSALFRHIPSAKVYVVLGLVIREADGEVLVIYREFGDPTRIIPLVGSVPFARPLDEFNTRFEPVVPVAAHA